MTKEQEKNNVQLRLLNNVTKYVMAANYCQQDAEFTLEINRRGMRMMARDKNGNVLAYRVDFDDRYIAEKAELMKRLIGYEMENTTAADEYELDEEDEKNV